MRKITNLFLLCALMLVSAVTAYAQTPVDYQVSDAPQNGIFVENTHWFTMKLNDSYVSTECLNSDGSFKTGYGFQVLSQTSLDNGLWCVVGDDAKGYKFYNKGEGATKVLALSYQSGHEGGDARAKMVDASLSNATSEGADQWLTTFDIHKNTSNNVGGFSISVKGLTDYYINQRHPYIAFWNQSAAREGAGSTFYFYDVDDVASYITSDKAVADNLKTTFTGHVGGLFQPTQAELDAFNTSIDGFDAENVTWENLQTLHSAISTLKSQIDQHKPVVGQKYAIKNAYTKKYITPNVIPGSNLYVYLGDKVKSSVWIVENGDTEGTFKLKNAFSELYANNVTVNTSYSNLYIVSNGYSSDGDAAIGINSDTNSNQWYHANNGDDVILFIYNAGASKWLFEAVSDDAYNAMDNNIALHINTLLNNAKDFLNAAPEEKSALRTNPTYANYLAYKQKVKEGTDNQYVRLQCAKDGNNRFLGLNDSYTVGRALEAANKETNLSNIWKLVPIEGTEKYKLMNANTGTYLTGLTNATAGANNNAPTLTDVASASSFTFTIKNTNNGSWSVIDENNNQLNAETNGCINYWTDGLNNGWYIYKATDIQVALHELGDASYATVYLPYSISAVNGATAYVAETEATNNTLVVKSTEDGGFAANAGVVLVSDTKAPTATLTLGKNSNSSVLKGTNVPVSITSENRLNYLTFGPKDGTTDIVGFWTPASSVATIPANRAYYEAPSGQSVALVFDGNITSISSALSGSSSAIVYKDAPVYDLSGRRIAKAVKGGVYIQNGKKFILK